MGPQAQVTPVALEAELCRISGSGITGNVVQGLRGDRLHDGRPGSGSQGLGAQKPHAPFSELPLPIDDNLPVAAAAALALLVFLG